MQYVRLQAKLDEYQDRNTEDIFVRLYRAISWLKCAEERPDNPDLSFITLWISFNACYAMERPYSESYGESDRYNKFIEQLVFLDHKGQIHELLWKKFSGPIRLLIDNQYAYREFWMWNRGVNLKWEESFENAKYDAYRFISEMKVPELLEIVLDRLYVVRNQLVHGGATYQSSVNRAQVKDGAGILSFLVPVIIDIMIDNMDEDWGHIYFPVLNS